MAGKPNILEIWGISAEYLTEVVKENPSLRGMLLGYVAEKKLREVFEKDKRVSGLRKDDDHDRTRKGDLVIWYRECEFKIEVKSLQTNSIEILDKSGKWIPMISKMRAKPEGKKTSRYSYLPNLEFINITEEYRLTGKYRGGVQCDASDRRRVKLASGGSVETTCLLIGEFDILAAGLFGFREKWDFGFALNRDLPRSAYRKYPPEVRNQLIRSLIPVSLPLAPPFVEDPFILLDKLVEERQQKKS